MSTKLTFTVLALALAAGIAVRFASQASVDSPLEHGTLLADAKPLPAFELESGNGEAFTNKDLLDRWTLLFFGFTNCPDVCPTTLATLATVKNQMVAAGKTMPQVVFVSVDPDADSAAAAARYASGFDPSFRAATGTDEKLRALTTPLGVVFVRVDLDETHYTVDHSTALTLIDPQGRQAAVFGAPHKSTVLSKELQRVVQ